MRRIIKHLFLTLALGIPAAAAAQAVAEVQTSVEAIAEDAAHYASRHSVTLAEAVRRLRAQEESVAVSDRIAQALRSRLAGISIEHTPQYRVVVLLTGTEPVANQAALAGGTPVPVVFQLGAIATRDQIVAAMRTHQPTLRAELPRARGMGLDPRTGELVLFVNSIDARRPGMEAIEARAESLTGVPVRVALADPARNLLRGGSRLLGVDPATGRRHGCTTGFVVRDAARTGVVTAAHCPDSLVYQTPDGTSLPLQFAGGWGVGRQDVQVHVGGTTGEPLFYANRLNRSLRRLAGARQRQSTRAGDSVCHWGEGTGYSCSEVELTDYAPPGDLCGGPCEPVWVTVKGPGCKSGDSGGPVFSGGVGFGILKGGSGIHSRCNFYYYMSLDFLPEGWRLLQGVDPVLRR
ncbi:MAG: S1 family peptidase [Pseudomonadota bacterium]|nr:S1 family peptidase [Pseudomonadota bacterium]